MLETKNGVNDLFRTAIKLQREGKLKEAIVLYQEAISRHPCFHWSHYKLGETLEQLGLLEQAVAAYQRALELKPTASWSLVNLSLVLRQLGRAEEAEQESRRAIEINPRLAKFCLTWEIIENNIRELNAPNLDDLDTLLTNIIKIVKLDVVKPANPAREVAKSPNLSNTLSKMIALADNIIQNGNFTLSSAPSITRKLLNLYQLIVNVDSLKSQAFEIYRLMVSLESICGFVSSAKINDSHPQITDKPFIQVVDGNKFPLLDCPLKKLFSIFLDQKLLDIDSSKVALEYLKEVGDFSVTQIFTILIGASRQADSLSNDSKLILENCDGLNFTNRHEESNLKNLRANKIFWSDVFVSERMCIPLIGSNYKSELIYPLGTIAMSAGSCIGFGFFAYPFLVGSMVIAPLYTQWISSLYGLAILDTNSNWLIILCEPKFVAGIEDTLAKSLIELISQSKSTTSSAIPKFSTVLGFRINFGHTIINEVSCLTLIKHKSAHKEHPNILIGDYDFLDTFSIVKSFGCQTDFLSRFKCKNLDSYVLPNHVACPLTTYRPVNSALSLVRRGHVFSSEENSKALYFTVDYRQGGRRFVNIKSVLNLLIESVINLDLFIIIDGLTGVNLPLKKTEKNPSLHTAVEEIIFEFKKKNELKISQKLIVTDGLTFPEKVEIFSKYNIKAAFSSFGSSLMVPIYILNVPIYILGSEAYKLYEQHRWHITRYCHRERILQEKVIKSSNISNQGYTVMLSDFQTKLEEVISSF